MAEEAKNEEMVVDATPEKKAFMTKRSNHAERIKKDEEELKEMIEAQKGETEPTEEAKAEDEEEPKNAEERTFKKRYGDLRRHSQEKEKQFQKQLDELKGQLSKATQKEMKLPKSDEDIENWAEQYPDVAGIVETIAAKKAQEMFNKAETRLQELDEAHSEAQRVKAENVIRNTHEDFDDLRQSDKFHNWADDQPKWVKDALYENMDDPASVIRVIDLYKIDNGMTVAAKKKSKKAAASTVAKGTRTSVDAEGVQGQIKESDVARMSNKEFEEMQDKINEAMRTGKFVYDMSRSA